MFVYKRFQNYDELAVYKSGGSTSQQRFDCNTFHISEILSTSLSKAPLLEEAVLLKEEDGELFYFESGKTDI